MINPRLTFAIYVLAAGAASLLYRTSYAVDELHAKIANGERQIVAEQQNIQVLGAEWTYLTEPTRIEQLAQKYLHLEATKPQRVAGAGDLHRVMAPPAQVANTQVASTDTTTPVARMVADAQAKASAQVSAVIATAAPRAQTVAKVAAVQPAAIPVPASTTPGSVKLLLASFQSAQPVKLTRE